MQIEFKKVIEIQIVSAINIGMRVYLIIKYVEPFFGKIDLTPKTGFLKYLEENTLHNFILIGGSGITQSWEPVLFLISTSTLLISYFIQIKDCFNIKTLNSRPFLLNRLPKKFLVTDS